MGFILQRIEALPLLHRAKEVPGLLTAPVAAKLKVDLQEGDASSAAGFSSLIATALIEAGEKEKAREWIDFGLLKDPTNAELATALRQLKKWVGVLETCGDFAPAARASET